MSEQPRTVLIVEDEVNLARVLKGELEGIGWRVSMAGTGEEAIALLEDGFDVMLLDLNLPGMSGLEVFRSMGTGPDWPEVVVMTGNAEVENAVQAMKLGVYDYLQKPVPMERLFLVLDKASEKKKLRMRDFLLLRKTQEEEKSIRNLVIVDPVMKQTFEIAGRVASTGSSVLVMGETGVGKDVVAGYIHSASTRAGGPFIRINCAGFQESMLENELFGHEKGAFTDAKERKLGFFEIASEGTIFLDEISEMPLGMQAKLLHVLEKGEFYRVGGTRVISSDARIITATNRNMEERIREHAFREDLYFRINMFSITIPPLRERTVEIIPLAEHFLREMNIMKILSDEAKEALVSYGWPGNVRELKHIINRASILATGDFIEPGHMMIGNPRAGTGSDVSQQRRNTNRSLEEMESEHIGRVLRAAGWKRGEAAAILGVDPKTLYRKIKKFGIKPDK